MRIIFWLLLASTAAAISWYLRVARQASIPEPSIESPLTQSRHVRSHAGQASSYERPPAPRDIEALRSRLRELEAREKDAAKPTQSRNDLIANRDVERTLVLVEHLNKVGFRTPKETLQTALVAAVDGDNKLLTQAFVLSVEEESAILAAWNELPEALRSEKSLLEVVTLAFSHEAVAKLDAIQIGEAVPTPTGDILVNVRRWTEESGKYKDAEFRLRHAGGEWKILLGEKSIRGAMAYLNAIAPVPAK